MQAAKKIMPKGKKAFCLIFLCLSLILDTFTDTAISSSRVNGDHKEKVLQRWEGGDSNGESYDLENDAVSCLASSNRHRNTN